MEEQFTFIIGKNASKTARSPQVWNRWYEERGSNVRMIPIDAANVREFREHFQHLEADPNCLGGAIAVPFKNDAAEITNSTSAAVNCVYRNGRNFVGTNTDGIAGAQLLTKNSLGVDTVYMLGFGATGAAIWDELAPDVKSKVKILTRSQKNRRHHGQIDDLHDLPAQGCTFVIFNATTVGGPLNPGGRLLPLEQLAHLKSNGLVLWCDINNSQDQKTQIELDCERLNLEYVCGNEMNLTQAIAAFNLVNNLD